MIRFIAEYKDHRVVGPDGRVGLRWGVEPMFTVLGEHGITISPSTYYEQVAKTPTRAQLRDEQVAELIRCEREHPGYGRFASTLGSHKMWIRLRGRGHDVARCTVERLMRLNGWRGSDLPVADLDCQASGSAGWRRFPWRGPWSADDLAARAGPPPR